MTAGTARKLVRGFRLVATFMAVTAAAAAVLWDLHALLGLAIVFGVGEFLETSVVLAALEMAPAQCHRRVPRMRTGSALRSRVASRRHDS